MGRIKKIKGLGDAIAVVTSAIGIVPCDGCKDRQAKLNYLFPFGTLDLTENEKTFLQDYFATEKPEISTIEQNALLKVYFRVYRVSPFMPCIGCSGVWKSILNRLKNLDYEN
jgi:hypothetical protein